MKKVKCVLVGDAEVGKTCAIMAYYTKKCYDRDYIPTVFDNYQFTINTGTEEVTLGVWDTAGNEKYDRLRPLSFATTDVVMIWFDVTKPSTYESVLEKWRPETNHHIPAASCILVGTHTDLRDDPDTLRNLAENEQQMITPDDGANLAQKIDAATYLECSTKNLVGIDTVFEAAARIGATTVDEGKENDIVPEGSAPSPTVEPTP